MKKIEYYTPSLNEFHVGFLYEQKEVKNNVWHPKEALDIRWTKINSYINNGLIRVKHITKEDIESLGFEFRISTFFSKKGETTITSLGNNPDVLFRISIDNGDYGDSFVCELKNISELKKILEQIGFLNI